MKEVIIKVYKYNELEEEAKNKVYNNAKNTIEEWRCMDLPYIIKECFNKYGLKLKEADIFYSLSYCQGDGVSFISFDILDLENIKNEKMEKMNIFEKTIYNKYYLLNEKTKEDLIKILQSYDIGLSENNWRYSHKYTKKLDFKLKDFNINKEELNEELIKELKEDIYNIYLGLCDEAENEGYNFLDIDEEEVLDFIETDDYYYFEDGEIYQ